MNDEWGFCGCVPADDGRDAGYGMTFAMSNRLVNSVSAFSRGACGRHGDGGELRFLDERQTDGSGTGEAVVDPLASQGALAPDESGCFLFAVNAGSNSVTSFRLEDGCLTLAGVAPSGGVRPVSIAAHGNRIYVLNAGADRVDATLNGFNVNGSGVLLPIVGSQAVVSPAAAQPACVVFSPDGCRLIVSVRNQNLLLSFQVLPGGQLEEAVTTSSSGEGPFGIIFAPCDILLVSEAGPNAMSSYHLEENGALSAVSASVANGQLATCWVAVTPDGRYAYTANAGSGTISVYHVSKRGVLTLIESVPTTPAMNGAPIDLMVAPDGRFLYVLNGRQGSISAFRIECEGHPALVQVYQHTRLPEVGAQGIAVL